MLPGAARRHIQGKHAQPVLYINSRINEYAPLYLHAGDKTSLVHGPTATSNYPPACVCAVGQGTPVAVWSALLAYSPHGIARRSTTCLERHNVPCPFLSPIECCILLCYNRCECVCLVSMRC